MITNQALQENLGHPYKVFCDLAHRGLKAETKNKTQEKQIIFNIFTYTLKYNTDGQGQGCGWGCA